MTPIAQVYNQFFDGSGAALESGSVYIGTINQNPETNPVSVYWDKAGTQPAAQPLKTSGGYVVRNGTPSNVFVSGDYSITVRDGKGALVYSSMSAGSNGSLGAALASDTGDTMITVKREETGAIPETLHFWVQKSKKRLTDFGFVADNNPATAAANDVAIAKAMAALRDNNGGSLILPLGIGYYTNAITALINGTTSRFFAMEGEGKGSTTLISTAGTGIKIFGDTPPARANAFVDVVLEGFSLGNAGVAYTGTGVDIYSLQRARMSGISVGGFDYGTKIRSSWNNTIDQRCEFSGNNVGIKVPRTGAGVTLNEGFNAIDIRGISCRQNMKAGLSLAAGNVISVEDVLLESNPVGIYLIEALQKVTLGRLYYEAGATVKREYNRNGVLQSYLVYAGKDEDGNIGSTASPVKNLHITQGMRYFGDGAIFLENVDGVYLPDDEVDRAYTQLGQNVKNVTANGYSGEDVISNFFVAGKAKGTADAVMHRYPHNWIANGNFGLPMLPAYTLTANAGSPTATRSVQSVNGLLANTMAVVCPDGATTITLTFRAKVGREYATSSRLIMAAMSCAVQSGDFTNVNIKLVDNNGNVFGQTNKNPSAQTTTYWPISCNGNINQVVADSPMVGVIITITRATGAGAQGFFIQELMCAPQNQMPLASSMPFDLDAGLSGTVTCSVAAGGWYYGEVDTGLGSFTYFTVQATPRFDSAYSMTEAQVNYLSGADDGKFRIYSNKLNALVDYRIVPKVFATV